jgi:hypothetical protein
VKLRKSPFEEDGLLFANNWGKGSKRTLRSLVGMIAPSSDVTISTDEFGDASEPIQAGDWLTISDDRLLNRVFGLSDQAPNRQASIGLSELRDEDGRIYGRARIEPGHIWSNTGVITVDGLAASSMRSIAGILVGIETTASRNSARPIAPQPVLAAWASEQALAHEAASLPDEDKALAAETILACGGDIAGLPFIFWEGEWLSTAQFGDKVRDKDEFTLHIGIIEHEDDDDVTKRDFSSSFSQSKKIARTSSSQYASTPEWASSVAKDKGVTAQALIEGILVTEWSAAETDTDNVVVGEVNGADIYREVVVYTRGGHEEEVEAEI